MDFIEAEAPTHIKWGIFGKPGSGKTYTFARVLSQFIAKYAPDSQLAMFDTENGGGHVRGMVKEITGKPLLAPRVTGTIGEMFEFFEECHRRRWVALIDSATTPYTKLQEERLAWRKSRVAAAHGNPDTATLTVNDWQYIKGLWAPFREKYIHYPIHAVFLGREGIEWGIVTGDDGTVSQGQTGVKMKTENELGHEPNLLVQMRALQQDPAGRTSTKIVHQAVVWKDRTPGENGLTGRIGDDPDIAFFMPHISALNLGGQWSMPPTPTPTFRDEGGQTWETISARRDAILEEIKNDLILAVPGRGDKDQAKKIALLRQAFDKTSAWSALEKDTRKFTPEVLMEGRAKLRAILAEMKESGDAKDGE